MWLIVRHSPMKAGWWDSPLLLRDLAKAIPIISGNGLPLLTENNFQPSPTFYLDPSHLLIFRLSVGPLPPTPPIIWNWKVFCKNLSSPKALSLTTGKNLENFWKSVATKEITVKKKRLWKNGAIDTNITYTHNVLQHVQISCLKNQHAKNQIVCLTTSFTIPLRKSKC